MNMSARFHFLTSLDLQGSTSLTTEALSALQGLQHLSSLTLALRLDDLSVELLDVLRGLSLTCLDLGLGARDSFYHFQDSSLESLEGLPLVRLSLAGSDVSSESLDVLKGMPMTDLYLPVGHTFLDGHGLDFLQGMPLISLDLGTDNDFSTEDLAVLQGLPL